MKSDSRLRLAEQQQTTNDTHAQCRPHRPTRPIVSAKRHVISYHIVIACRDVLIMADEGNAILFYRRNLFSSA